MFGGYDPLSSWQVRGILRKTFLGLSFSSNKHVEEKIFLHEKKQKSNVFMAVFFFKQIA